MTSQSISDIRIYIACLAAYNNGILHGAWIDADQGEDHIWNGINQVLKTSPISNAKEWAIHDFEGFGNIRLSEYEDISSVTQLAEFIAEHGPLGAELYTHFGCNLEDAQRALNEQYHGIYESLADFAQQLTEDTIEVPDSIAFYIDYDHMGRDMAINDIFTIETAHDEVHVFWQH